MSGELRRKDEQLARRHGAYLSYATDERPSLVEHHGPSPAELVDRLLDLYARPDTCILDLGCGAGQTLCRLAPRVREAWGVDLLEGPLQAARLRAESTGLANVTLIHGDVTKPDVLERLPDSHFAFAFSRRGPNFSEALVRKLTRHAYAVQELVAGADGAELRAFLGRRTYDPYPEIGHEELLRRYRRLGLFPISSTELFYEEFFRDVAHLERHGTCYWVVLDSLLQRKQRKDTPSGDTCPGRCGSSRAWPADTTQRACRRHGLARSRAGTRTKSI